MSCLSPSTWAPERDRSDCGRFSLQEQALQIIQVDSSRSMVSSGNHRSPPDVVPLRPATRFGKCILTHTATFPRAYSSSPSPVSVGEPWREGIGRPAPFSEAGPRCLPLSVSAGAAPSLLALGIAIDPRPEVGRYLRHRAWHRGTRFDLSDCAWHLSPPHGLPFPNRAPRSFQPTTRSRPGSRKCQKLASQA
jgi:hypothetical protein